jgi:hypothetical protein
MKPSLLSVLVLFVVTAAAAATHEGAVVKLDPGRVPGEETHVYLSDGFVLKIPANKTATRAALERAEARNELVRLAVDADRWIESVAVVEAPAPETADDSPAPPLSFAPTVLSSEAEASRIFANLRPNARGRSQCYNRAHVWAYESKRSFNLDSLKVFMFYTRRYIREYNFEWWFHVAPATLVRGADGGLRERILDYRFTRRPHGVKEWTDVFMRNKVTCPVIARYSEYERNEETGYCFLQKVSMYYLQPLDLDRLEQTGQGKTRWLDYEVRRAYRDGFEIW